MRTELFSCYQDYWLGTMIVEWGQLAIDLDQLGLVKWVQRFTFQWFRLIKTFASCTVLGYGRPSSEFPLWLKRWAAMIFPTRTRIFIHDTPESRIFTQLDYFTPPFWPFGQKMAALGPRHFSEACAIKPVHFPVPLSALAFSLWHPFPFPVV